MHRKALGDKKKMSVKYTKALFWQPSGITVRDKTLCFLWGNTLRGATSVHWGNGGEADGACVTICAT